MHLTLAPLHGFTDSTFRNVFFRHFGGIDDAVAPFISLTHGNRITAIKVRDLIASNHPHVALIPQVLGNDAEDFIMLCRYLSSEMGFTEVNWNLGCPIRGIVTKKRGSGILPFPSMIRNVLGQIIPAIDLQLSVKLRLGYHSADEFAEVISVLNDFPLKNITIHPRTGIQMYGGDVQLDALEKFLPLVRLPVIYNGDIHSFGDYVRISRRFPEFGDFMLGRGLFFNPFLAEMIRAGGPGLPQHSGERFRNYYYDLEEAIKASRSSWMSKMKEYWKYFGHFLQIPHDDLLVLMRCRNSDEWHLLTRNFIDRQTAYFT